MTHRSRLAAGGRAGDGGQDGALVALDPNNGDILAMVSHPAFDPDIFGGGVKASAWHELMTDPNHPLQNRVIQGIYPPGSTFKIVDSIAGLEEGTLDARRPHTTAPAACGSAAASIIAGASRATAPSSCTRDRRSCDVYFYNVGEKLGVDRIAKWAHLMGLGVKSGIDLDHENPGTIPSSAWKQKRFHERWYPAETLSVAIGQGYVATTPLQMAQVAAEVANGGTRYRPQFVKTVEGLDGNVIKSYPPVVENATQDRSAKCSRRARRDGRRRQRRRRHRAQGAARRRHRLRQDRHRAGRRKRKAPRAKDETDDCPTRYRTTHGSSRSRPRIIRRSPSPASSSTAATAAARRRRSSTTSCSATSSSIRRNAAPGSSRTLSATQTGRPTIERELAAADGWRSIAD